ncbi:MAG TPA: hypothetical protein VND80_06580 [Steroidobacteraceae bacterium]|nr:hypothetical protein [Steroidobacteraceae bacterium]
MWIAHANNDWATRHAGALAALSVLALAIGGTQTAQAAPAAPATLAAPRARLRIPGGGPGIGFDDIGYFSVLDRVSIPAGRTGMLDLIDPRNGAIAARYRIAPAAANQAHRAGTTSAAYGDGYIFASDHEHSAVVVLNAHDGKAVSRVPLASEPDYVRYLGARRELWVTEPRGQQIQVFRIRSGAQPRFTLIRTVAVPGGPESLVFDSALGRAYTNLWKDKTAVLDLAHPGVIGTWRNGCAGPRGLALDEARQFLFVGCAEGAATVLDLRSGGRMLAKATVGAGVDIISYSAALRHLYVPGARAATLTVFRVSDSGALQPRALYRTAPGAHCVTDDGRGRVFVCDPRAGRILEFRDQLM